MKPLLALLAAVAALAAWLNVRDLIESKWDLRGYATSHSDAYGHHPWWFHALGHRWCLLCKWERLTARRFDDIEDAIDWLTDGKGLPPDPDDDMAGVQVDVRPYEVRGEWAQTEPRVSWPALPPIDDGDQAVRVAYAHPIGGM